ARLQAVSLPSWAQTNCPDTIQPQSSTGKNAMETLTPADFADDNPLSSVSRRVFVKGLGFVSVALILSTLGGCDKLADAIKNRPVRRRLRTGSAEVDADIATYRDAVAAMKALPAGNPTSWAAQAAIHGTANPNVFIFCEHGTDHFFDWHRAYLFYFEKICQKVTGKPKFGLPYWNWNQNPAINPGYLDPNNPPSNALFQARNDTDMTGVWDVSTAALDPIMGDTNFFTFMSQIEGTPHNTVHCAVGGIMCTGGSPLDPIFWNHHCMIDYCWTKWNIELNNNNTNDATWINHVNSHFVDADGNPATQTAGLTTLMPLLSYRYESSAIGNFPAQAAIETKAAFEKVEKRIRAGANIRFEIKKRVRLADKAAVSIAKPIHKETRLAPQDFAQIINSDTAKERIFASIEWADLPAHSDFSVRVFVNLPSANSSTSTEDPHFAGSFAFFGTTGAHRAAAGGHAHQPRFLVNITNTIQRLREKGELNEGTPISIQLVPVPFAGKFEREDTQLQLNGIEIITTPVIINPPPE
ncbi:MAG TPA: tyrosinase family protein, partial [Pyrinomonadaceae bacterium]|nr:tyrosinase family protein [Pyrinomonadaceae bacterium]